MGTTKEPIPAGRSFFRSDIVTRKDFMDIRLDKRPDQTADSVLLPRAKTMKS